jgi:hypothetical protein
MSANNYTDYYIRVSPNDYEHLIILGEKIGLLIKHQIENGDSPLTYQEFIEVKDGSLDYIGEIYRPTGEYIQGEFGNQIPVQEAIKDPETGIPYIHVNIRTSHDIMKMAIDASENYEEVQEALNTISRFFVTEPDTNIPKVPKNPARVFF